jgi:hypothetical protein
MLGNNPLIVSAESARVVDRAEMAIQQVRSYDALHHTSS